MNELGTAMRAVAEDVDVRAGFAGDVLRGGRRRRTRGRRGLAVALAAVVGLVGFGAGVVVRAAEQQDARLLEPTRGGLAENRTALRTATDVWLGTLTPAWRAERRITEVRGEPHAYWAGATADGDAVVVMQEAKTDDRWWTLAGVVAADVVDGRVKVVNSNGPDDPEDTGESFQFGLRDRTFLVLDRASPVYVSPSPNRDADGRVRRVWSLLPTADGVGVWTAPEDVVPRDVRLVVSAGPPTPDITADRLLTNKPASHYLRYGVAAARNGAGDVTSLNTSVGPDMRLTAGMGTDEPPEIDWPGALRRAGVVDIAPEARPGSWRITGRLPNGGRAVLGEYQDGSPNRLCAVLLHPDGTVDRVVRGPDRGGASWTTIQLRLPDQQGWVVGALWSGIRYRTSPNGEWQGSSTSAAVLPDEAVQIEVLRKGAGSTPEVLDLIR